MSKPCTKRPAFTLFSMLVLLGIGGLLLAMFFPAVIKARSTAQRLSCTNNLKQLALGIHNYADSHRIFPGVGVGEPDHKKDGTGSWCFRLLPYVEQDNVYRQNGGKVPVGVLYCPERRPARLYNDQPKTDYAGNVGTALDPEKPEAEDGAFTKAGIKFTDITDGTSNTILFGEKGLRKSEYETGKGAGDKNSCWTGGLVDALRSSNGAKRPPARDTADEDHDRGFGSAHEKVCNVAFCDGSVHSVRYNIDAKVFQYLCGRNDGMPVNRNDF